jgi:biopolymer transport protein ExbD
MPVVQPKRRPAFPPIGRLRTSPISGGGKKGLMLALNLTAMVDMFTVIVIFLLQSFSADGDLNFLHKDLKLPEAKEAGLLSERGPVLTLFHNTVMYEHEEVANLESLDDAEPGIPVITEALTGIRERDQALKGNAGEPYEGHVIIQADHETDFKLVRKVIYSLNEAGWAHMQFIVIGLASEQTEGEGAATE